MYFDQSGRFDLNVLPDPPGLIRSEDRTRSIQLTVQKHQLGGVVENSPIFSNEHSL